MRYCREIIWIILIGDAAPNTIEEVKSKRNNGTNPDVWKNSIVYQKPTCYIDELKILKSKEIIVHAFYVDEIAKKLSNILKKTEFLTSILILVERKRFIPLMSL
jgi:hypothetical protein